MNAAEHTRTMYGQLAIEKLNKEDGFIWNVDKYLHLDKKKILLIYKFLKTNRII